MTAGPTLLIILDGFGHAEPGPDNAISLAHTPTWDRLWTEAPHRLVDGSGLAVGLPDGQMGNSEVGHMNLGAGRVIYQELTRINQDAASGALAENATLLGAVDAAKATGGRCTCSAFCPPAAYTATRTISSPWPSRRGPGCRARLHPRLPRRPGHTPALRQALPRGCR